MNSLDLPGFDLDVDDDDLRRRLDALAGRADMPVLDPLADLRRARDARRRRRAVKVVGGLAAAAAVSALVIGNLSGGKPDASGTMANDPSVSPTAIDTPYPDLPERSYEVGTFAADVAAVMGASPMPGAPTAGSTGSAILDSGAITLVTSEYRLSKQVTLDIRAGVSREVLEWKFAEDTSDYPVGDDLGERGTFGGAREAYIFDQPDGDVVMVVVEGLSDARGPSTGQINALLTDLDVPSRR